MLINLCKNNCFQREHKETSRENEKLKRLLATQKLESMSLQQELEERDKLIEVIVLINFCQNKFFRFCVSKYLSNYFVYLT